MRSLLLERSTGTLARLAAAPDQAERHRVGKARWPSPSPGSASILIVWGVTAAVFGADWGDPARRAPDVRRRHGGHVRPRRLPDVVRPHPAGGVRRLAGRRASCWRCWGATCSRPGALPEALQVLSLGTPNGWALVGFGRLALLRDPASSVARALPRPLPHRAGDRRAGHGPGAPDGDAVIPIIRVNLRRAVGDRRCSSWPRCSPSSSSWSRACWPGAPRSPSAWCTPRRACSSWWPAPATSRCGSSPNRAQLGDDILRGRVVAGLVALPAPPGSQRVDFVSESASTSAIQARTDVVALLDLIAAEGTHTTVTDVTLAHTDVPAALSPFSYVAPADLVLFLGITVLLLSSGVVESRRLGLHEPPGRGARAPALGGGAPWSRRACASPPCSASGCWWSGACSSACTGATPPGCSSSSPCCRWPTPAPPRSSSMRSRTEEQAISRGRRARHRVRDARRLHVPPRRGGPGGPRRRPRRAPGLGHGRVRQADLRPRWA